jgi:hypothetical protein
MRCSIETVFPTVAALQSRLPAESQYESTKTPFKIHTLPASAATFHNPHRKLLNFLFADQLDTISVRP